MLTNKKYKIIISSKLVTTNTGENMSSKKSEAPAKKGLVGWIFYFAGNKKGQYIVSVFFALLSVACCIAPYFIIARIVQQILAGVRDWQLFLKECGITAAFWAGNL